MKAKQSRKQKAEIKVRFVHKNTKSRKGWYAYVKQAGEREGLYRKRENTPHEEYVKFYKERRRFGKYAKPISVKKPIRKFRFEQDAPQIGKKIKRGMSRDVIPDAYKASQNDVRKSYKKMLKPLVKDEGLLNLLLQESNIAKMKHRFEVKVTVIGDDGKEMGTGTKVGSTPIQAMNEVKGAYKKGETVGSNDAKRLSNKGWDMKLKEGTIEKIKVEIFFRKG